MRTLRTLGTFKLGFWAGLMTAAAFMRRAVPSRGDEESDELALVAIMNGIELKSRATAFRGGSMLAWFGGIAVDLKEAELAPDAHLEVRTLFGGIAIRTPPTWRVVSTVKTLAGGVDIRPPVDDTPDAPALRLDGVALFGGVTIGSKASTTAVGREPAIT